ncbi:hypothetical protein FORC93_2215 [Salmonella enterica subsp. enterica serovar Braenderup]|nr:hypothetical protein FORC93_2215 [Salmonella enterica subsp. enterica serovar Braenderup]
MGCVEEMSVTYINQRNVKAWLKNFPGALNDTGGYSGDQTWQIIDMVPVMNRNLQ